MFKLDRNTFKKQSFEDASNQVKEYKKLSINERLKISFYLNSIAFNFDSTSRIITSNKIDSASFCNNIMRDLQQQETIFQKF